MTDRHALAEARAEWRRDAEFRRIAEAYLHAFDAGAGALVLEHLRTLFDGNTWAVDAREHAYNAGRRSVLLHIETLRQVAAEPPTAEERDE
jgi:hypothetical protein